MICIFEDHEDADISILFREYYPESVTSTFLYAEGNGNLYNKVEEALNASPDTIVVYMDLIPDNRYTVDIYNELRCLSRKNGYRVVVFPIVCVEYCFLKSIKNTKLFINSAEVVHCLSKRPLVCSNLLKDPDTSKYCKNFEKYCKYLLKYNTCLDCLKPFNKQTGAHGVYYRVSCFCDETTSICEEELLENKSRKLLHAYRCVPSGNSLIEANSIGIGQAWEFHRQLVDEYNCFANDYKSADPINKNKYKLVQYIK